MWAILSDNSNHEDQEFTSTSYYNNFTTKSTILLQAPVVCPEDESVILTSFYSSIADLSVKQGLFIYKICFYSSINKVSLFIDLFWQFYFWCVCKHLDLHIICMLMTRNCTYHLKLKIQLQRKLKFTNVFFM